MMQVPLQHWVPDVQALPAVLQVVLRGVQVPPAPQIVLQHSLEELHDCPSETHLLALHTLPTQANPQQSLAEAQAAPTSPHAFWMHAPATVSQRFEQQSPFLVQDCPLPPHVGAKSMAISTTALRSRFAVDISPPLRSAPNKSAPARSMSPLGTLLQLQAGKTPAAKTKPTLAMIFQACMAPPSANPPGPFSAGFRNLAIQHIADSPRYADKLLILGEGVVPIVGHNRVSSAWSGRQPVESF
jgi:hypothetical protein